MKKISVGDIVSRAWDLAVKHWPVFVLLSIINSLATSFMTTNSTALTSLGQNPDPEQVIEALTSAFNPIGTLVGVLVATYLGLITWRMLVNAYLTGRPYENLGDALKVDLSAYGFFLGVEICLGLALGFGWTFCLIPGLILTIRWWFTPLIAATEKVSFTEAFGRSWQMTQGHFWELFLLRLAAIGIAIVGLCACCVGVLFAEVIINFMVVLAYFQLKDDPIIDGGERWAE